MSSRSGVKSVSDTSKPAFSASEVLLWVAQGPSPWFPSQFAASTGIPRDNLDEPLNALRSAGLVRVLDWVRGMGQGYGITEAGVAVVKDPARVEKVLAGESAIVATADLKTPSGEVRTISQRPLNGLTTFDRGELARKALLDPAPAILAPILVLACVLWFLVGALITWKSDGSIVAFIKGSETLSVMRSGGLSGMDLLRGEWWRLISASFVHIGAIHLLLNMYGLGAIGGLAESLWGRKRFVLIYLISGLAGGCLAMISRPDSLVAGASGAFWGLMTSTAAWMYLYRQHLPEPIVQDWAKLLIVVMSLNILISFAPGVSWEGHLGGGVAGFFCSITLNLIRSENGYRRILGAALTLLFTLGIVSALLISMNYSDKWTRFWQHLQGSRELQYFQTLTSLAPDRAELLYPEVALTAVSGARASKVLEKVTTLGSDARKALGILKPASSIDRILKPVYWRPTRSYESARVYFQALVEYSDSLEAALRSEQGDLRDAAAKKKLVLQRWQELNSNP